jgi:hypothetical protein
MPSILGYLLELIIKIWRFGKKIFEIWRFWTIVFMKKPLNSLKSYSSGRNLAKSGEISLKRKTLIVLCSKM